MRPPKNTSWKRSLNWIIIACCLLVSSGYFIHDLDFTMQLAKVKSTFPNSIRPHHNSPPPHFHPWAPGNVLGAWLWCDRLGKRWSHGSSRSRSIEGCAFARFQQGDGFFEGFLLTLGKWGKIQSKISILESTDMKIIYLLFKKDLTFKN